MPGFELLALAAAAILVLNLPFGYWRARVQRFSLRWFLAVHAPVPVVAGLRILAGIGWQWRTFPVLVVAYFGGQFLGGRLRSPSP